MQSKYFDAELRKLQDHNKMLQFSFLFGAGNSIFSHWAFTLMLTPSKPHKKGRKKVDPIWRKLGTQLTHKTEILQ